MEFLSQIKRKVERSAFRIHPTYQNNANNHNLNMLDDLIQEPRVMISFLKVETTIGLLFNIPFFLILLSYLPFNLKTCLECDFWLTCIMLCLSLANSCGIPSKLLSLWKLQSYNINDDETYLMRCLWLYIRCNLYHYNS